MCDFNHLHCHTQYSLLDGAARIKTLIGRAQELEMSGLAITDHGNLYGVPEFYTKAKKAGIKPIIGCEFYLTPSGMTDKTDRTRYHQVLLAKNEQGYRNLIKLSSLSYTDGYYYKPRLDKETLKKYSEGLVASTCCLQGEVLQTILKVGEDAAKKVFEQYIDIFGEDYYIEIQDHGIPEQRKCNAVLMRWAKQYNVKVIATNDVHYVEQPDAKAQDVLLCLQTGKDLADPNRMRFENDQFYLKSADEMRRALTTEIEAVAVDAMLDTTREIVDKCNLEIPMGKLLMPHFPLPPEFAGDINGYLRHLVYLRARERYGEIGETVRERLDLELRIIGDMGFAGYFLIVQDFTTAARKLGVSVGPGRGSAAGSAVAYCLGITNIDPLKYDLLFERFLNPERVSMPDIDIDFDDRGRGKVIDYVVEKYGRENVCQIITFGTMGAKSVIKDVSRVLGIPLDEANRISGLIPDGVKVSLDKARQEVPEFRELYTKGSQQVRQLLQFADVLEGSARHTGVHAAGVIIAPGDVSEYVPVSIAKSKGTQVVTTQYDGSWVEEFGLLKMDFLGLKTLTIIDEALRLVKENHGVEIDPDDIPLDDEATFRLFQKGDTVAIFQFESSGMREYMVQLQPTCLDDLIAMNALYRPGPMEHIPTYIKRKHGREAVQYPHAMLEPILKPTYGIPVYQEQVMQMAQVMGGFSLGKADILRRGMGKKKQSVVDAMFVEFQAGARKQGVDDKTIEDVWSLMAAFAGYGFNKSHAAAYSVVAYQTAYIKAHYPAEFMAAVMTSETGNSDKLAIALEEARHIDLPLLPPDINRSGVYFSVERAGIRFGLNAIKGAGTNAVASLIQAREKEGPFTSLFDLCGRADFSVVNKKTLECLACAGAFDELGEHRAQIAAAVEDAVRYGQKTQADKAAGQNSLFGEAMGGVASEPQLPWVDPWPRAETLKHERDLIGFYVSGHPLDEFAAIARSMKTADLGKTDTIIPESEQRFCGIITDIQQRTTRSGRPIAFVTIEDYTGQGELILFSTQFEKFQPHLLIDSTVLVRGKCEIKGGHLKIIASDVAPMWKVIDQYVESLVLRVNTATHQPEQIEQLYTLCDENRGRCKLYFEVTDAALPQPVRLRSRQVVIDPTPDLLRTVTRLLGSENVRLEATA